MSSLSFFGLSVITFGITYGIAFLLMPMILGSTFGAIDPTLFNIDSSWLSMYNQNLDTMQYLLPLIPTFAILILVIKVLLTSSARGMD